MDVFWTTAERFVDKFGVALFVLTWFMFRQERFMNRLASKVNRLIISTAVIAKTLDLQDEQDRMINAVTDDDDSGPKTGRKP